MSSEVFHIPSDKHGTLIPLNDTREIIKTFIGKLSNVPNRQLNGYQYEHCDTGNIIRRVSFDVTGVGIGPTMTTLLSHLCSLNNPGFRLYHFAIEQMNSKEGTLIGKIVLDFNREDFFNVADLEIQALNDAFLVQAAEQLPNCYKRLSTHLAEQLLSIPQEAFKITENAKNRVFYSMSFDTESCSAVILSAIYSAFNVCGETETIVEEDYTDIHHTFPDVITKLAFLELYRRTWGKDISGWETTKGTEK